MQEAGILAASKGFRLNLEMLNTEVDHSGYFLDSPQEGIAVVKEIGLENVKALYDVYHMGIMTGNLTAFIKENIDWIGHFHSAGIPGRHDQLFDRPGQFWNRCVRKNPTWQALRFRNISGYANRKFFIPVNITWAAIEANTRPVILLRMVNPCLPMTFSTPRPMNSNIPITRTATLMPAT